jgi:transmembrane sensor
MADLGRNEGGRRVPGVDPLNEPDGRSTVDDLIIKVLTGSASPFEEERLSRWREAAPENEEYFQDMVQVWALTVPEPVDSVGPPPEVEAIIKASSLAFPARSTVGPKDRRGKKTPWMRWGLLAASAAALALGLQFFPSVGPAPSSVYRATLESPLTVTLEDGSFVRLAAGSSLEEWEAEGRREVSFEGRAFFAVARDDSNPFVVRTGSGEVRVLGTRFQLEEQGSRVETVVVEGLVELSNKTGSVEVPAGSVGSMTAGASPTVREVDDVFAFMSWPKGVLVFQATPLSQVVEEVSRQYGRTLRIEDASLAQRRVTAWFQGEPFEAVAESICIVTEAECRADGMGVIMGMGRSGG